jgi:hypothetical protein
MTSLWVKDQSVWHEIKGAPAALPGLGGWADITAVTGNPTKHAYKDAAGVDWVAYEWKGTTADTAGSITTTEGLIDVLVVGGGAEGWSGSNNGNGAQVVTGLQKFTAAAHPVVAGCFGQQNVRASNPSHITGLVGASVGQGSVNAGASSAMTNTAGRSPNGVVSSISGAAVEYAAGGSKSLTTPGSPNHTGAGGVSYPGVVIIRVPAEHAKA